MSKVHEDNAGYVGVSYEETQDPFYSYNKLSLPLSESDRTVIREEQTFVVTQANSKFVIDGVSQAPLTLVEGNVYTFDLSDSSVGSHPFRIKKNPDTSANSLTNGLPTGYSATSGLYSGTLSNIEADDANYIQATSSHIYFDLGAVKKIHNFIAKWTSYVDDANSADYRIALYSDSNFTTLLAASPSAASENTSDVVTVDHDFGGVEAQYVSFEYVGGGRVGRLRYFYPYADTTDVTLTTSGTQGQSGATAKYVVPFGAGPLAYYCASHSGMGADITTPTNAFMFDGALPILKTTGSLGATAQYTVSGGSFNAGSGLGNIFDGSTSTEANHSGGASDTFTLTFSPKVQVSTSLQVYLASGSSKFSVNGGSQTTVSSGSWTSLSFTGELETLAVQGNSTGNYAPRLAGIRVDGKDLGCGAADPYAANLVLALPMNGTNNDTTFTDSSATIRGSGSPKTISRNGNTKISTAQSIFYGSSAEFDGTDDNLKLPANDSDFQFGSGDFTIETWFRPDSTARMAIYHGSDGDDHSIGIDYSYITQTIAIWASSNGTSWDMADGDSAANRGSTFVPVGVWTHIAYVRYGSKLRLYINGVLDKEFTNSNSIVTETEAPVIGEWYNAGYDLDGYLADFRIYKGVAKYTSDFFVPTPVDVLDRSGNGNNASNAGATWQTSVKKFYGGAVDVGDGIITVPQNQDLRVSGSNFTAECWVYADTAPTGGVAIFNHWGWSSDRRSWTLQGFTGGEVRFYTSTNGQNTTNVYVGTTMPVGQWFHLAGVVEGTAMRMYINGTLIGSTATNNNDIIYDNTTDPIVIGDFSIPTGTRFDGKVQDCKLYKGVAKYSSSFTPPERSVQGTARRYPSGIYVMS